MPREAGKYGRKPFDPGVRHLVLERYLDPRSRMAAPGMPAVPATEDVDRASQVASWPMYLNDQLGDCTIAGAGHMFGAMSSYAGLGEALFADSVIEGTYSAVGGYVPGDSSTDQGCLMSGVLAYLKSTGMPDVTGKAHRVAGYARLGNPADLDLLGQVLAVTGTVYVGIDCQAVIQQEFAEGQPWQYVPGQSFEGGHCIVLQRRFPEAQSAPLEYVTWGALQGAMASFQMYCAEEAWFVVSEDFIRVNGTTIEGMDLQQLLADAQDL